MNTLSEGQYRWMIFREGEEWVGVALEFNIVVVGDDPRVVEAELQEAAIGYIESAKETAQKIKGLRLQQITDVLNQHAEEEYESRWTAAQAVAQGSVPSPLSPDIYKFGMANLATA